jgi:hypothetical protein
MPHCFLLKVASNGLQAYLRFFFSEGCACDVCDWPRGDYSPTAPSLRQLVPSGSLIWCEPAHVYHHHLCSFRGLCFGRLFFRFGGDRPLHNVQSATSRSPVEDLTIRFPISSSTVFLQILPDALSFLRRSYRLAPRFLMPILHSGPSIVSSRPSVLHDCVPYAELE